MVLKEMLLENLKQVELLAGDSKWRRFFHNPIAYLNAIIFKEVIYNRTEEERIVTKKIFTEQEMKLALPASTDIYLTGGKSHPSEIKLARFLIQHLNTEDHFLDIGAHYGFFSLLALKLVGDKGKLVAIEPSSSAFKILTHNFHHIANIQLKNQAVNDAVGHVTFYEFPNRESEYNTMDVTQFKNQEWYIENHVKKKTVEATTIDALTVENTFNPSIIKIDVEGGELKVLQGGAYFLRHQSPLVAMEYLSPLRGNENHQKAVALMRTWGYQLFTINNDGNIEPCDNPDNYLEKLGWESDNIIFSKNSI